MRVYNSVHRQVIGQKGDRVKMPHALRGALTSSVKAGEAIDDETGEPVRIVKLPYVAFLDPARRFKWEPQS